MKATGIVGIILIVLGAIALAIEGFDYTKNRDVVDVGPIKASVQEEKHVAIPPIAGIVAIAVGLVLVVVGRRK